MTLPAIGGIASAMPASPFELLGTAPASAAGLGAGASGTSPVDPALQPFAGVLARIVGLQGPAESKATPDAQSMVEAALASLESALSDGVTPAEGLGSNDAGTSAIKALLAQVARQGNGAATAPSLMAADGVVAAAPQTDVNAQALGAAAMIAPAASVVTVPTESARTKNAASAADARDDDTAASRTGVDDDRHAAASQTNAFASNAAAVDPSAIVRETAALDPVFRAKLDRVIERMEAEYGHKVTIVETVRSQTRQDALFEQGRSAPGQVVTWTRNSRHADGLAADVMIDGGYDNAAAFERLQRIAHEEGLHTLGSRDAGHLELRVPQAGGFTAKVSAVATQQPALRTPTSATPMLKAASPAAGIADGSNAMARIARVARVAEVAVSAGVARVANVARIAMPGSSGAARATASATAPTIAPTPSAAQGSAAFAAPSVNTGAPAGASTQSSSSAASAVNARDAYVAPADAPGFKTSSDTPKADRGATASIEMPAVAVKGSGAAKSSTRDRMTDDGARSTQRPVEAGTVQGESAAAPFVQAARGNAAISAASSASGPDQTSRVAQIDALHEQAAAQPVSSMVLTVDDGQGGADRIRVDVRGGSVASTIDVRDQASAQQLADRSGELARALESHGLESEGVRVRAVAPPAGAELLRGIGGGDGASPRGLAAALTTDASTPSRRDRDESRDPHASFAQKEQDSHRQRSRREREESQP